ncbi:hypothetical protein D7X30_18895 [Corallococcus sp. AB011P]|uniref:hypothetical protein n=1 Tax=unclassified Corallococcus TaxID=2685029 RepID=UPI000EA052A5|nr:MULTISPECIES: hypothetical protein [unclassified Corallococcus]RKG57574.1 hypothetical protein D7X30_18895 [Corallococcus sp. AB011P]RKH90124.1 hypothetical protein D7Y21_07990 [Corallococcus sp. AB045]
MSGISVRIDTISVLGLSDEVRAQAVQATVQDALRRLAERLAKSPLARSGVQELALERLSLDALPADELLSERGAERLADELYSAVMRRFP